MENKLLIEVEKKIITVRKKKVILDSDVAELYDVLTKEINQGVRNNPRKISRRVYLGIDKWRMGLFKVEIFDLKE